MNEAVEKVNDWCEYGNNRAYILMMFARRKYNNELTNSTEIIHRRVIENPTEAAEAVKDLSAIAGAYDYNFRLYCTVNARDIESAYFNFAQEMLSWSQSLASGDEGVRNRMGRIGWEWESELHAPRNAADSYFHFDLDNITDVGLAEFIRSLPKQDGSDPGIIPTDGVYERSFETPNGYHVLTEPFNYTEWEPPVAYDEMDTDGMFHVEAL